LKRVLPGFALEAVIRFDRRSQSTKRALLRGVGVSIAAIALLSSCQGPRAESSSFTPIWRDYTRLASHRALATAGRLEGNRWVVGIAAGMPSAAAASEKALDECRKQRRQRRMQSQCVVYAVENERLR